MCERKHRTNRCGVPDWLHNEWAQYDKRELLHLSLVEALKAHGTSTDAATRKLVKARLYGDPIAILYRYIIITVLQRALKAKFVQRVTIRIREKEKKLLGFGVRPRR